MQLRQLLEIGLTNGEAKVYTALLELGSTTTGPLVKKSGVAYSNVYEILNRLISKGMASFVLKEGTKYFQAAGPENLVDYIEKKEKELNQQKQVLNELVPKLALLQKVKPEQEAEIFVGLKGMKAAYSKMIANYTGGEWLFFYLHDKDYGDLADRFYLSIKNILRKSKTVRGITNPAGRKAKFTKYSKSIKWTKYRFADFPIPGNLDIYKDYVLVQAWSSQSVAFLIKSDVITDVLRQYFESVWTISKK
ncbi:MAG: hypothetical protein HY513_03105 [Candidatus Aenigmarchaeota archaeon]|nr:hypothetical protein [Candidatus Aenigmarchaeota archaeon]